MNRTIRIGTRDSQLALWQATTVQHLLDGSGILTELVPMKSEGDIDTVTPLYELGVQGVFTKTLDAALLSNRIDIAVHSMKDMPTRLARGVRQAAVLARGSHKDILVYKGSREGLDEALDPNNRDTQLPFVVATSSIRRMAQWLHRYPHHQVENLRGNVNTRLRKVAESNWNGAIFAAAGLERIQLRPEASVDLDWMLPAPSQGAIMVVCREGDERSFEACQAFNDEATALCTSIEKDFLRVLMGGCSTPISALAQVRGERVHFRGSICSTDGAQMIELSKDVAIGESATLGADTAGELLNNEEAQGIINTIRNAKN